MHRTQIQLEEHQYRYLQKRARESEQSLSALLRDIVAAYMRDRPTAEDPLWDLVGMEEGEEGHVARDHDKYLYGKGR